MNVSLLKSCRAAAVSWSAAGCSALALALLLAPPIASAQPRAAEWPVLRYLGVTILDVRLDEEGRTLTDPQVVALLETRVGEPLSMGRVRDTLDHLFGLGRYQDVRVLAGTIRGGVVLTYFLSPIHAVQRVDFTGPIGLDESELRQVMTERFGPLPPVSRIPDIVRAFQGVYRDRGYRTARIVPRSVVQHATEQTFITFEIDAGRRTTIGSVDVRNATAQERLELLDRTGLRPGRPYDRRAIDDKLAAWADMMRSRGYYEAQAIESAVFSAGEQSAAVTVDVSRGPHVTITFAGDPIPADERDPLVPVRREGSVDEDLLEDAQQAIRDHLQQQGYRQATVEYIRQKRGDELTITFTVRRGPRFTIRDVQIEGNHGLTLADLRPHLRAKPGDPFVQQAIDTEVASIVELYRSRGFSSAIVRPTLEIVPDGDVRREVAVTLAITEGPATLVGAIGFRGNEAVDESILRAAVVSVRGQPYYETQIANDRDNVQLAYLNRGYQNARVDVVPAFSADRTRVDVTFAIVEGPLVRVDHVLIVGNTRTHSRTIVRELLLKPGQPLGYADLLESQRRLSALGLFRRVRISEVRHGSDPNRDVLISVEEAPATSIGWGGGLEGSARPRRNAAGLVEERLDVAPRGFVEIGRRNLWGKNRSVNLYSRVSLRARDPSAAAVENGAASPDGGYGFNEYRIVGTFREPKVLNTGTDAIITGSLEQAVRSSFNFARRTVRAEVARRVTPRLSVTGQYQFSRVRLFDEQFTPSEFDESEQLLIDRLFPQVRLSMFSSTLIRDRRDDALDPDKGTLATVEGDLAGRRVGSEVGFAKAMLQGFYFHRVPARRRVVLALGARVGLAKGFRRQVERTSGDGSRVLDPQGRPIVDTVEDVPASERFFAGGDTTVRGFALDRLGTAATISRSGFPTGGNGLMIYNAEVRFAVAGPLGAVLFLDAGNVYSKVKAISFGDMRKAAGFGVRYRSPIGPIRIDVGFKLDRRELSPGNRERLAVVHISLGQAF